MRILAAHLFNDYSGSPKVLMQLVKAWIEEGHEVHLSTCSGREGFLSNIEGVNYNTYWYKLAANPYIRLIFLMTSQLLLMAKMMVRLKKGDLVYVNTVLPFGAALAAKIRGVKVIYHIHETSLKPKIFKSLLFGIVKRTADQLIFVSHFLAKTDHWGEIPCKVIYNALPDSFLQIAEQYSTEPISRAKNLLMVCSLKEYKGVNEFAELASNNQDLNFRLILNASQAEVNRYFKNVNCSNNLELISTQTNLHPHYQWADVILNLSRIDGWIETFGLTIIEGMAYGLPAIVPPLGGIVELVDSGHNGFRADSRDREALQIAINKIINFKNYPLLSKQARIKLDSFTEQVFKKEAALVLEKISK